ncbi:hypothetical protein chiPu_0026627, partial [Chiloscyllium punctatum]|nr:hypothetical protein [Chiloscyllium punctatum]
ERRPGNGNVKPGSSETLGLRFCGELDALLKSPGATRNSATPK